MTRTTTTTPTTSRSMTACRRRRLAVGLRHDFEDPLGRRRHHRSRRGRSGSARGVLPDARRRRAGLLPPAVEWSSAPPTWRRTSRWPTSRSTCSARPGCCWPGRPRPTRGGAGAARGVAGAARGRAGVLPRRGRPSATCGSSRRDERRLRRDHRPAADLRDLAAGAAGAAGRRAATRCSPRSRPRASRRSPTTATTPAAGSSPWPRARRSRVAGCWPHSRWSGPATTSCSAPTRSSAPRRAGGRRRSGRGRATRWTCCWSRCSRSAGSSVPAYPRAVRWPVGTGRDGVHTEAMGRLLAEMQVVARAHPLGTVVTAVAERPRGRRARRRPRDADADVGRPRRAARRRGRRRTGGRGDDHAYLFRVPGDGHACATTWCTRCSDDGYGRVEVRVSLHPAWSSDWITSARPTRPGRARHLRARRRASSRRAGGLEPAAAAPGLTCPRCGSGDVELTSEFGATACKALYRCGGCLEPFEHVKEI